LIQLFKRSGHTPVRWIGMFALFAVFNPSFALQAKKNIPANAPIDSLITKVPGLMRSNISLARKTIVDINRLSKAANYQHGITEGTFDRCWYMYHMGNTDPCIALLDSSIKHLPHLSTEPFPTKFNILLGQCYVKKEKFNMAVKQFSIALKVAENNNDDGGRAGALVSIGWAYMEDNKPTEAIGFFMEILKIKSSEEYLDKATVLDNIAACYNLLAKYKDAENYAKQGVAESRKINSLIDLANGLNILVGAIFQQGNSKQALIYLNEASKVREKVGDPAMLASDYMELSDIYRKSHQLNPAIAYAEKAVAISVKNKIPLKLESAYGELARSLDDAGDYKRAAIYYKKLLNYKDSANTAASNKAMAEMLVKYNTQKKIAENLQLKQDNLNARLKLVSKQRWLAIIAAITGLIIVISIFIYFFNRNRYKTQLALQQVAEQRNKVLAVLETEERERKRIAADLHDGVCQMLAAVSLQLNNTKQPVTVAQDLLDMAAAEVRSVSHQMSPELLKHYGLVKAIENSLAQLNNSNIGIVFNFYSLIEHYGADELLQVMIYRAFQELVNNVIKHAKASEVNVHLTISEQSALLMIEDDGLGFNVAGLHSGLGLKSLANRVKAFNGTLTIDSTPGRGTTVIAKFDDPVII
jgi:signal transduction histidine kinase